METVLLTSGFYEPELAAAHARWHVIDISSQREALNMLRGMSEPPAAVCIGRAVGAGDDLDAWGMLKEVRALLPRVPVIVSTAVDTPKTIVEVLRNGAFDYVVEPSMEERAIPEKVARFVADFVHSLSRAVEWSTITRENRRLREAIAGSSPGDLLRGGSRAMRDTKDLIARVAPTRATVLITGESGTGKELVARSIHALSSGRAGPFVALNCGAFSEHLIASELFGHEKGAFTGADRARAGLIREADGGTLFLDEISAIPPAFQVMLLRVLEQRLARPVGGTGEYAVKCRFVAAANRDLASLVETGAFREDLYYRLKVFHIEVPPLRERREDIPGLADLFVQQAAREYGRTVNSLTPAALESLETADWPGNVRQLRHVLERAVIVCEGDTIDVADLERRIREKSVTHADMASADDYDGAMRQFERRLVERALVRARGNRSGAARLLHMKRCRLNYRMRLLGLDTKQG